MAIPSRPEQTADRHEAAALKPIDAVPKLAEAALPSQAGNEVIRNSENRAGSDLGLPHVQLTHDEKPSSQLGALATTEAVTGSAGALGGGAVGGIVGKGYGSLAEIFLKPLATDSLSVSNQLALDGLKIGATRGGLAGLAVGALAFGAYEVLKQSAEHPDRAPDPAALI